MVNCWLGKDANGQYVLTLGQPVVHDVRGVGKADLYVPYGDPIGHRHICEWGAVALFGESVADMGTNECRKVQLKGSIMKKIKIKNPQKGKASMAVDLSRPNPKRLRVDADIELGVDRMQVSVAYKFENVELLDAVAAMYESELEGLQKSELPEEELIAHVSAAFRKIADGIDSLAEMVEE